jgi:N-acetylmuramoyl-L-alanine amidase CwlA
MKSYTITQDLLQGIPQTAFRNGVGQYEGVVCHCTDSGTGDGSDTPKREHDYEQNNWKDAFVHDFVGVENGQPVIRNVASHDFKSWHAGATANARYIGIELCMYNDPATFTMAYDAYCFLIAKTLFDRKLGVVDGVTILSHAQVSNLWKESDHQDPIDYLNAHGISWTQHVANVTAYYNWLIGGDKPSQPNGIAIATSKYPSGYGINTYAEADLLTYTGVITEPIGYLVLSGVWYGGDNNRLALGGRSWVKQQWFNVQWFQAYSKYPAGYGVNIFDAPNGNYLGYVDGSKPYTLWSRGNGWVEIEEGKFALEEHFDIR